MSFQNPLFLLALLAVPLAIGLYVLAERRRMRYAVRFTNMDVLASVAGGSAWRRYVPPVLALLALTALCLGVARPERSTLVPEERATVILVIDDSLSMQARDVRPTRLEAAKAALRTFLDRAPDRLRIGLIVFSGEAQVAAPPTTDHGIVRESVGEIGLFTGFGGTAIGDALKAAVELAEQAVPELAEEEGPGQTIAYYAQAAEEKNKLVSILFLSDGSQTRGTLQPLEGAQLAADAGVPVYTIALGTPEGVLRGDFGPGFGSPGTPGPRHAARLRRARDPGAARPGHAERDRRADRRRVLRGEGRRDAAVGVRPARLQPRPETRQARGDVVVRRRRRRLPPAGRPALGGVVAAAPVGGYPLRRTGR